MTEPELLLWARLRRRQTGYLFRRQRPIGPYVADFYCHEALLVAEVDGRSHDRTGEADRRRDAWMQSNGYEVLRIEAAEVLRDVHGVVRRIAYHCGALVKRLENP